MAEAQDPNKTSHFDADALAAAQEAPTLTVGNYLYRGRLLSIEEWLPWWERFSAIQDRKRTAKVDDAAGVTAYYRELMALNRGYLEFVFPRRRYRWWAPDPVKHLLAQPFVVIEEAMVRFFFLQACATFGKDVATEVTATRPAPPGTPSQPPIPSASGVE